MRHQGQFPQETSVKCVNKTMNRLCAFSLLEEKPVTHTHTHTGWKSKTVLLEKCTKKIKQQLSPEDVINHQKHRAVLSTGFRLKHTQQWQRFNNSDKSAQRLIPYWPLGVTVALTTSTLWTSWSRSSSTSLMQAHTNLQQIYTFHVFKINQSKPPPTQTFYSCAAHDRFFLHVYFL